MADVCLTLRVPIQSKLQGIREDFTDTVGKLSDECSIGNVNYCVLGVPRMRLSPYVFVMVLSAGGAQPVIYMPPQCPTITGRQRGTRGTVCRTLQPACT